MRESIFDTLGARHVKVLMGGRLVTVLYIARAN